MRKPTSLYLNELQVSRVSRRLEKALDGHGSLSGFFTWLEEQAYPVLMQGEYPDVPLKEMGELVKILNSWSNKSEQEAITAYRQAWEALAEKLPWHRENPAASHVLALFLLNGYRFLWDRRRGYKTSKNISTNIFSLIFFAKPRLSEILNAFRLSAEREKKEPVRSLLWWNNRLEILAEEPRSKPFSFFLDDQAHAMMMNVFKGSLFERLLGALDEVLVGEQDEAWRLQPVARFLEQPRTFFQYWPLPISDSVPNEGLHQLANTPENTAWLVDQLRALYSDGESVKFGEHEDEDLNNSLLLIGSQALPWKILPLLSERFGWESVRRVLFDSWPYWEMSDLATPLLLRLSPTPVDDPRKLPSPEQALGAFIAQFEINELRPERRLLYAVIKKAVQPKDDEINDPVQLHALGLLQAYALEVLPEDERDARRVSLTVLRVLGKPNLFPIRDTLEAWSGMRVQVDHQGRWRLYRGRKLWRELTEHQAYWVTFLLNAVECPFNTNDEEDDAFRSGNGEYLPGRLEPQSVDPQRGEKTRMIYPLGEQPIELALQAIELPTPLIPVWAERRGDAEVAKEQLRRIEWVASEMQKLATEGGKKERI
jgi:hypothetical protein